VLYRNEVAERGKPLRELGFGTRDVLAGAGMSDDEIEKLLASGAAIESATGAPESQKRQP